MKNEFFSDGLLVYIENKISKKISVDTIINYFHDMQKRSSVF